MVRGSGEKKQSSIMRRVEENRDLEQEGQCVCGGGGVRVCVWGGGGGWACVCVC